MKKLTEQCLGPSKEKKNSMKIKNKNNSIQLRLRRVQAGPIWGTETGECVGRGDKSTTCRTSTWYLYKASIFLISCSFANLLIFLVKILSLIHHENNQLPPDEKEKIKTKS